MRLWIVNRQLNAWFCPELFNHTYRGAGQNGGSKTRKFEPGPDARNVRLGG
jgi:hypothetical protein